MMGPMMAVWHRPVIGKNTQFHEFFIFGNNFFAALFISRSGLRPRGAGATKTPFIKS
ncbi:MAG: hypothetical protein QG625_548 [Cyanobacteriota bacterium erpe_2018_sw_39hr_WHONDRS-SW48-000098_B_bin.30]|jgi:hypothetical protein|nr:hypothetical protein [Cyanobacteriota bacterium erpe_2018_sw_39hr_WHONDRS-SW48-000098_B_bin.30]